MTGPRSHYTPGLLPPASCVPGQAPESRYDHIGTLLGALADALAAFPDLYLANLAEQEAGTRPVKELLDRVINHPLMKASPEVRGRVCVRACERRGGARCVVCGAEPTRVRVRLAGVCVCMDGV